VFFFFPGEDKENQFVWQVLSQIIPFFGIQTVMLYMINSSNNRGASAMSQSASMMKKGLIANSHTSYEDPDSKNPFNDSSDYAE
jgi:hypothetical protein